MKNYNLKKMAVLAILILILGYFFKEETIIYCVGNTYYIITYLTIAIYILYLLALFVILKFLIGLIKRKKRKSS